MTSRKRIACWAAFGATCATTWFVYVNGWMFASYQVVLSALAMISLCFAVLLLREHRSWRSIAAVALMLVMGQWWLFEWLLAFVFLSFRGLAP